MLIDLCEINDPGYDYNNPGRKSGTGHFTQVWGWKNTYKFHQYSFSGLIDTV